MSKTDNNNIVTEYLKTSEEYKKKYGNRSILLYQVGSFFEIYALKDPNTNIIVGSNIEDVCKVCDLNYAEKKIYIGENIVLMAGVRDYVLDKYLKILTDNNYTAVVFVQEKITENKFKRVFHAVYSPGTYISFETDSSPKISNNIMCIWIEKTKPFVNTTRDSIICGISVVNNFTGESYIFEYQTTFLMNPTSFDELERAVSIYLPSEIILITPFDDKIQNTILQYIGALNLNINIIKPIPEKVKNCEKQIYISKIISTFFGDESYNICSEFSTYLIATQALCFLLDFIKEHNPNLVRKLSFPEFTNKSDRIVLANHTLQQLNIINDNDNQMGNLSSVSSFLNRCCTSMGKRSFFNQITNPTSNIEWLNSEYNMIDYLLTSENSHIIDYLRKKLPQIRDLEKISRQLVIKKLYPNTIFHMYNSIFVINEIYNYLKDYTQLIDYCGKISKINELLEYIREILVIEDCKNIVSVTSFDTNIINSGVSLELDSIIIKQKSDKETFISVKELLNYWMRTHEKDTKNTEYIKCHETEKSGCSLQITKRRGQILKSYIKSQLDTAHNANFTINNCIFHLKDFELRNASSNMDEIIFPELQQICKRMLNIDNELNNEIAKVYNKFLFDLEDKFFDVIENIAKFVIKLDVLHCKSFIAKKYNYCKPIIDNCSQKSFVSTEGLRHCLIEHINQNEIYVTNDLSLGTNDINGMLLFGTNAVGKTSLIRALGISLIMAQTGLFVPSKTFVFKPYTAIYSRILGNDNLFKGLSTFAVEMSELRVILKMADENSLILGDEICSGTETVSALSIFITTLCKLDKMKSSYIFATHFHEITKYDEVKEIKTMVMNHLSVTYDAENECLVYDRKLQNGTGDSNYGLIVAKSLFLPEDFMDDAYSFRRKYFPSSSGELSSNITVYNAKKIKGICEMCKIDYAEEIHHLIPQKNANKEGFIDNFHKNHPANLQSLCGKCHLKIHHEGDNFKPQLRKKTTKGYVIK